MDITDTVAFVRDRQPRSPESPTINKLRTEVIALCRDTKPVRFFTAVGSPLDIYHGVDAFFEQDGRIATLDLSLQEKESIKADVLLKASLDRGGNLMVNETDLMHAARGVADRLNAAPHLRTM